MPAVVAVGVISAVPVALMIRSALATGFAVFVAPIVLAHLLLLGAVYLIWRGLGGGEPASERVEEARPDTGRRPAQSFKPAGGRRPPAERLHGRSLVGRTGA